MIIDLITNSENIISFVKNKEGFNGKIEEKGGFYKLINVQIGYVDEFSAGLDNFIKKENPDKKRRFYYILTPNIRRI